MNSIRVFATVLMIPWIFFVFSFALIVYPLIFLISVIVAKEKDILYPRRYIHRILKKIITE